jgi:hypothetical protein
MIDHCEYEAWTWSGGAPKAATTIVKVWHEQGPVTCALCDEHAWRIVDYAKMAHVPYAQCLIPQEPNEGTCT